MTIRQIEFKSIISNSSKNKKGIFKKNIFNISAQIGEIETAINSKRDWEISDKTEDISVRARLKENTHFWKNELRPSFYYNSLDILCSKQQIRFKVGLSPSKKFFLFASMKAR